MPRPPEGQRICIRIPVNVLTYIDELARASHLSRAAVIRQLLENATR